MSNPNIDHKAAGDNVPFTYDWKDDVAKFGDKVISESHWTVDVGTITIGADGRTSNIQGTVTECYIQGGDPGETAILNNSVLLNKLVDPDSGDKLVRRFAIRVTDGAYEPGTPPVVILPDGIPNLTDLAAFRGATPGVSVWVDTTPTHPNGTIYFAMPNSSAYTPDGELIVQGQLVKWVELHVADGATGTPISRTITSATRALWFSDPDANVGQQSHNFSHDMTISGRAATHTNEGLMSSADKTSVDALTGATLLTASDESGNLPNSYQVVPNANSLPGASAVQFAAVTGAPNPQASIDVPFGTTSSTYMRGDGIQNLDSFRKRIVQVNGSDKIVGYENAYAFTGTHSVLYTITISETEWQGTGAVHTSSSYHLAHIEIEFIYVQQDFSFARTIHRALIYKLRTGGVAWAIAYDGGTRDSTEDTPAIATYYLTSNVTLSGANNGDINIGIEPTGAADPKSEILVFVNIHAGGKYA